MKVNLKRAFRHPLLLLKSLSPFSLAHHPSCEQFSSHCVGIMGHRLCIGCFIGFPATFAALAFILVASYMGNVRLALLDAILLGVAIEGILLVVKIVHHAKSSSARVALKIAQATGIAFLLYAPISMPLSITGKILAVFVIWMILNASMSAVRMYEIGKTCDACEYKARWSKCPGFKETIRKLHEAGFISD